VLPGAKARGAANGYSGALPDVASPLDVRLLVPTSASSDGRFLLYTVVSIGETRLDLWVLPLTGDRKPFPFLRRAFDQRQGRFSPDGQWIAYVSNESGRNEVLVRPFTSGGAEDAVESLPVSKGGGIAPRWRGDGKELFYLTENGTLTSVTLATDRSMVIGRPTGLFQVPGADADWPSPATVNDFFSPHLPARVHRRRSQSSSIGRGRRTTSTAL
jgi:hypothetical protein